MTEISSLSDWRIRTEKLEGAGLGKEEDRCAFAYMEFELWVASSWRYSGYRPGALEKYLNWYCVFGI